MRDTDKVEHVTMGLRQSTIKMIEEHSESEQVENKTEIVSRSIRLAHWLVQKRNEGATIAIEHPSGDQEPLPWQQSTNESFLPETQKIEVINKKNTTAVGPEDNIFSAIGFQKGTAAVLLIRAKLQIAITKHIEENEYTPQKAADHFGATLDEINWIRSGEPGKPSTDRLIEMAATGGFKVQIEIQKVD